MTFSYQCKILKIFRYTGGWSANQGNIKPSAKANKEAKHAFDKAMENLTGCDYDLVAVLGSQVVAGTNYSYLCRTRIVYPGEKWKYEIINVYEDLEGNCFFKE